MEIPRFWRTRKQRLSMNGVLCEKGHPVFPPKPFCKDGHKTSIHPLHQLPIIVTKDGANVTEKVEVVVSNEES